MFFVKVMTWLFFTTGSALFQFSHLEPKLNGASTKGNGKAGNYAGVARYGDRESTFCVCDENGAREETLEGLLEGPARESAP